MKRGYLQKITFEQEIQPRLHSIDQLQQQIFDLNLMRTILTTRGEHGSVLMDLKNLKASEHAPKVFLTHTPQTLLKMLTLLSPSTRHNSEYTIQMFDCHIQVITEDKLQVIAIAYNQSMSQRTTHLLKLWMKHHFTQLESEFTPKILRADIPTYEVINQDRFLNYIKLFRIYSEMDLGQMLTNFNIYIKKLLTTVIPYNKARFLLSRMMIFESQNNNLIIDHSFVKDTARNIDFLKSKNFQTLLKRFDKSIKQGLPRMDIMQSQRRRSVLSNYNNRTYNKDTLQEVSFGQYLLKISTFKTPLDQEYKIGLVFEKNLKRKQKLDKKTFKRLSKKLNRRQEEQNNRNDKYIQVVDFFRFLFDFKRSYPFSQFINKHELNRIKAKARTFMQRTNNTSPETSSSLSLRRKFGSEMTVQLNQNEQRLMGSFQLNKDSSKDQTGIHTKMSNAQSQYSILNLKIIGDDKLLSNKSAREDDEIEQYSPSSSHTSSNQSSSSSPSIIDGDNSNIRDQESSFTLNFLGNTGLQLQHLSKEFLSFHDKQRSVLCGMSLRAIMNNDVPESLESLSVNNPVSDEVDVELDLNEYKHSLYDMINDSIVTISSIQEFDKGKDWLSQQVAYDSSESEGQNTLRILAGNIQVGLPPKQTLSPYKHRPSIRIEGSNGLLRIPHQKRPSIRVSIANGQHDLNIAQLANLQKPRRHSMRGNFVNNLVVNDQINSPAVTHKSAKRPSFLLSDHIYDGNLQYTDSPKPFIRGIIEKVREEEEDSIDEAKIPEFC